MLDTEQLIADNVRRVLERIDDAAHGASRAASDITLVGVTKTHPPERVVAGVRAGLQHLGENRVQEADGKIGLVAEWLRRAGLEAPVWHFIGHLQSNKVVPALRLFQVIESVDSLHLAEALSRRVAPDASVPILLEMYVGEDAARPGFRRADLADALGRIAALPGLDVRGLMTVAPLGWKPSATQAAFAQVRETRDFLSARYPHVHLDVLSMGMSDDFELAIAEGATSVRIGRALFGAR
ncbi:MAG: YggS family pyridoxal phosphate-dependent enzyme [Chloroflexi bacterium]|nr:YggS family pyridoxal phosphate-dependent enzyme [Chloroflexota bacterium]